MSERKRSKNKQSKSNDSNEGLPVTAGKFGDLFLECKRELDASQDQRERLVKLSRDCTIHSKRAIFTLHRFSGVEDTKEKVLEEADAKFAEDIIPILRSIREEIGSADPYRHHSAYSPGLQEFIEALAYYRYLKSGYLISFEEAQSFLTFQQKSKETDVEEAEKSDMPKEEETTDAASSMAPISSERNGAKSVLYLPPSDFILGLADLTGELMRLCINAVGSGNRELPFALLPFFRALFCGFHSSGLRVKHMNQKMAVLRSSLGKVESACYTIKVRGSEIPKQDVIDNQHTESGDNN
jgi:predicted translin family RNA/ssDNA-binding protein